MVRSTAIVGWYVPPATQISSPDTAAARADCRLGKASAQLRPVFRPAAAALTNQTLGTVRSSSASSRGGKARSAGRQPRLRDRARNREGNKVNMVRTLWVGACPPRVTAAGPGGPVSRAMAGTDSHHRGSLRSRADGGLSKALVNGLVRSQPGCAVGGVGGRHCWQGVMAVPTTLSTVLGPGKFLGAEYSDRPMNPLTLP